MRGRGGWLPVLFLLLGAASAFGQVELKVEKRVRIEAPEGYSTYTWFPVAGIKQESQENGRVLLIEGPAGSYTFMVICTNWEEQKQEVGSVVVELGSSPSPPGPGPGPDIPPGPGPGPAPVPDDKHGFGKAVQEWMRTVKPEYLGLAPKLSSNFEYVATLIRSGDAATIDEAIKRLQERNKQVLPAGSEEAQAWSSFNNSLNQKLGDIWPIDKFEFLEVLKAIADSLGAGQ